jgi:hypothetical protein
MLIYTWRREQSIPLLRTQVFEFFADLGNLERITASWLSFLYSHAAADRDASRHTISINFAFARCTEALDRRNHRLESAAVIDHDLTNTFELYAERHAR